MIIIPLNCETCYNEVRLLGEEWVNEGVYDAFSDEKFKSKNRR